MKIKSILSAAAISVAALFASCGSDTAGYVISGTAEGAADGDSVFLCQMQGYFSFVPTDTAIVKDGKFEFTGDFPGADYRVIVPTHKGKQLGMGMILLENARINVEIYPDRARKRPKVTSDGENYKLMKEYMGD